jgi:hypothetical protein
MTDQSALVPLSQPLGMGPRDKTSTQRDNGGTATGTIGLKALAAKVLHRDKARDNSGTAALCSCPTADEGVGQTFGPVSLVPADDLDERVAGLSTEPRQHKPEGLLLPTPGRPAGGESDAVGEPVMLRDGRRLYRFRAVETASSGDAGNLLDRVRWRGVVLVADGRELIVVERWLSTLSPDTLRELSDNAGAIISTLIGEGQDRLDPTRTRFFRGTSSDQATSVFSYAIGSSFGGCAWRCRSEPGCNGRRQLRSWADCRHCNAAGSSPLGLHCFRGRRGPERQRPQIVAKARPIPPSRQM